MFVFFNIKVALKCYQFERIRTLLDQTFWRHSVEQLAERVPEDPGLNPIYGYSVGYLFTVNCVEKAKISKYCKVMVHENPFRSKHQFLHLACLMGLHLGLLMLCFG